MTSWIQRCVLVTTVIALLGCQAPVQPPTTLVQTPEAMELGYRVQWTQNLKVPASEKLIFVEQLGDVIITIEAPTNMVSAIAVRDGSLLWRKIVGANEGKLYRPNRIDGHILVNSSNQLFLLDVRDGTVRSAGSLESAVANGPVVIDNLAIFGALNGRLFAHSIITGDSKWSYQMGGAILTRPTITGGNVLVCDATGAYMMFDARTRELLWLGRTFARISADPAVDSLGVFIASEDNNLYALQWTTGQDRWIYRSTEPIKRKPVLIDSTLYVYQPSEGLIAVNALNGERRWVLKTTAEPVAQVDTRLILHSETQILVADSRTGKVIKQATTQPLHAVMPGPENSLILVSANGRMMRIDPRL